MAVEFDIDKARGTSGMITSSNLSKPPRLPQSTEPKSSMIIGGIAGNWSANVESGSIGSLESRHSDASSMSVSESRPSSSAGLGSLEAQTPLATSNRDLLAVAGDNNENIYNMVVSSEAEEIHVGNASKVKDSLEEQADAAGSESSAFTFEDDMLRKSRANSACVSVTGPGAAAAAASDAWEDVALSGGRSFESKETQAERRQAEVESGSDTRILPCVTVGSNNVGVHCNYPPIQTGTGPAGWSLPYNRDSSSRSFLAIPGESEIGESRRCCLANAVARLCWCFSGSSNRNTGNSLERTISMPSNARPGHPEPVVPGGGNERSVEVNSNDDSPENRRSLLANRMC